MTRVPAVDEYFQRSEQVWESSHQRAENVTETRKQFTDRHCTEAPVYKPGDRVGLSIKDLSGITG